MYTANAKLAGIIGKPISHSRSPLMHNYLASELKLDFAYTAFHIEGELKEAISAAKVLGISGLNITIPYKNEVLSYVDELSTEAKVLSAVNTLVKTDKGYKGYNTDIVGVERSLRKQGISLKDRDVIVLGAGGAAKAVLYVAASLEAGSIYIISRDSMKSREKLGSIQGHFPDVDFIYVNLESIQNPDGLNAYLPKGNYIVFQASPVGMSPDTDKAVIELSEFYDKCDFAMDLVYNPLKTKFMSYMEAKGKRAINGLDMLIYQGVRGFELWNDVSVDETVVEGLKNTIIKSLG